MPSIDDSKTVLVTGATAGIGRALALAISDLPSHPRVIATGRRKDRLEELRKSKLETIEVNLDTDKNELKKFVDDVLQKYPDLDTVILCAGIQHEFTLTGPIDIDKVTSEININYTSVVTLISLFMPHFTKLATQGQPCFIVPVTSGLGITPGPPVPNYSATKAALHNFTISLRVQLQGTNIHVLEIIPPLVESELHDAEGTTEALSKFWMSLDEYIPLTMNGLRKGDREISAGGSLAALQKFEPGKIEMAEAFQKARAAW
ncbi:hypothetical protein BDZ94DRAFT_146934 [Collybia nuda]|uniref:NAD(P)-binding protein n=1 Tax=Collybia nuda TaxID=64659 RepID=A0A9P5XYQ8_9AGAR|nr:hypothetical protein BDZ94DRAFT_146934 [Collybia nuda]